MDNDRQITFRITPKLWIDFSVKCIKMGKTKTSVLIQLIKDFLKK